MSTKMLPIIWQQFKKKMMNRIGVQRGQNEVIDLDIQSEDREQLNPRREVVEAAEVAINSQNPTAILNQRQNWGSNIDLSKN